jgi:hypothetical protein
MDDWKKQVLNYNILWKPIIPKTLFVIVKNDPKKNAQEPNIKRPI